MGSAAISVRPPWTCCLSGCGLTVLELSSFQLAHSGGLELASAAVLNIGDMIIWIGTVAVRLRGREVLQGGGEFMIQRAGAASSWCWVSDGLDVAGWRR